MPVGRGSSPPLHSPPPAHTVRFVPPLPGDPTMRSLLSFLFLAGALTAGGFAFTSDKSTLSEVKKVELQPLAAQAARVAEALERLGAPLSAKERKALEAARTSSDHDQGVAIIQNVLDKRCLAGVLLRKGKDGITAAVQRGPAAAELAEQGWRVFLVKVHNPDGVEGW